MITFSTNCDESNEFELNGETSNKNWWEFKTSLFVERITSNYLAKRNKQKKMPQHNQYIYLCKNCGFYYKVETDTKGMLDCPDCGTLNYPAEQVNH